MHGLRSTADAIAFAVAAQAVLIMVGAVVIAIAAVWGGGHHLRLARASA